VDVAADEVAWAVVGILATMAGLGSILWSVARAHFRNTQDHETIIAELGQIARVEKMLEDVLTHPNESSFSTEAVRRDLTVIRDHMARCEQHLQELIKHHRG
jgi:hypothetical protein